jgi:hypothetical protein
VTLDIRTRDHLGGLRESRVALRSAYVVTTIQLLLVAGYAYGVAAYLTTDAAYFTEEAPPAWSWPAVIVTGFGWVLAIVCLLVALPLLAWSTVRAHRSARWWLGLTTAACGAMLLVMATPPGWFLFDWYFG